MSVMPATIRLRGNKGHRDEKRANGALSPGHLVQVDSSDKVLKNNVFGGRCERIFALEDALQGNTVETAYADGDLVFTYEALPGDIINTRVPAKAVAIVIGDKLISNGDGTLVKSILLANSELYSNTAAGALTTPVTTAETDYALPQFTIPANSLQAGDVIHIRAEGIFTTTTSTDTVIIKLYLGATAIVTTTAIDVANNDIFVIDIDIVVRTVGASGTMVVSGSYAVGTPGEATTVVEKMTPWFLASTALDTTAAKTVKLSQTWSGNAGSTAVSRLDVLTAGVGRGSSENELIGVANAALDNSAGSAEAFLAARMF